jgi:large subunit ribosomal protein L29
MKYNEIKRKTKDELIDLLKNLKKENYNLRFQKKNGQLEKTGRIDQVKKDIARIRTKLNEKILGDNNAKKNIEG